MIREAIVDAHVTFFQAKKKAYEALKPNFVLTDETLVEIVDENQKLLGDDFALNDEERELVLRKIKSINTIFQDEGSAILGDYEHDYEWYNKLLASDEFEQYYWERYKNYLQTKRNPLPQTVIDILEHNTLKNIMSYLGNPNDSLPYSIRGLVVGDVQSGKTSNYIGLATKAADAGYKVIFVLTGTIESLRQQTQQRIEEGFIGYDSVSGEDVGVKRGVKTPKAFTSRANDFTGKSDQNTTYKISDYSTEPMIFILKKNKSVLQKVYASLKTINTTAEHQRIDYPILVIDDEADNASVNTNKLDGEHDPTVINSYIRKVLALFTRSSYVGFTATPFANVFISYDSDDEMLNDDLFPRDFIYALYPPTNYCGARRYFFTKNNNVIFIKDDYQEIFPLNHTKDWSGSTLYGSVYYAINCFLLSNAIRDIRDPIKTTHRSMLINMSRFTAVQSALKDIIETYVKDTIRNVKQCYKLPESMYEGNKYLKDLKDCFNKEFKTIFFAGQHLTWKQVLDKLYESIKNVDVVVVNSSKQSRKLNYEEHKEGLRVIAIGGLALSRGLTLEGLCCSYFYRNTSTYDVLMQMGRWFGYRDGYDDICRIFITKETHDFYRDICIAIEDLKADIDRMGRAHKKPSDYGIRVRNSEDLSITARNKMQNTKTKIDRHSFYGCLYETPYLHADSNIMKDNIDRTLEFMNEIDVSKLKAGYTYPYFDNIPVELVKELLSKIKVHEANANFDTKQLLSFLNKHDEIKTFNVLFMGGGGASFEFENIYGQSFPQFNSVSRNFDLRNNKTIVRMSSIRAHLWGPSDPAYGLTKEQREEVIKKHPERNPSAAMYLDEYDNPLLIVYFVTPIGVSANDTNTDEGKFRTKLQQEKELRYRFLVGYAIGFPSKDGQKDDAVLYTVNEKVNYYDKMHEEDEAEVFEE